MKFDELDLKMRVFETSADFCVLPGMFMVARLDGRSFTRLTKEVRQFEAPFDEQFREVIARRRLRLYQPGLWRDLHHYIFWFHDSTFECIARSLRVETYRESMKDMLARMVERLVA